MRLIRWMKWISSTGWWAIAIAGFFLSLAAIILVSHHKGWDKYKHGKVRSSISQMLALILILLSVLSFSPSMAADVTIVWKCDSTVYKHGYIYTLSALTNYGRVTTGGATTRVIGTIGTNYSNTFTEWQALTTFKDSCDAYGVVYIDSIKQVKHIQSVSISAGKWFYIRNVALDTIRRPGEGNGAAAAANCEMCWDSCNTVGSGTCATRSDWGTDGAVGTADTMGMWTGKPSDSFKCDEYLVAGNEITLWLDTLPARIWKDNTGTSLAGWLTLLTSKSANMQASVNTYGDESNMTGAADSVDYITLYGRTSGAVSPNAARRVILSEEVDEPDSINTQVMICPDSLVNSLIVGK